MKHEADKFQFQNICCLSFTHSSAGVRPENETAKKTWRK